MNPVNHLWDPSHEPIKPCLRIELADSYVEMLKTMILIRQVERTLALGRKEGVIKGPVHLGIGQEAVAAGVSRSIKKGDAVFGAHRSHAHILALRTSVKELMAEVLAKSEGLCGGRGGSMHLIDKSVGFFGSVPIVAGTVPLAVGAAIAAKNKGNGNISVVYMGDGACEEGVVHESLNMAKALGAPTLFVVENNLYASHMHISERQPAFNTSRYAEAHGVKNVIVDGNDAVEIARVTTDMVTSMREAHQPAFLECVTYRWLGHVDYRDDIDVGITRSKSEIELWKRRDPIQRLWDAIVEAGVTSDSCLNEIRERSQVYVDQAWSEALQYDVASTTDITDGTLV